MFANAKTVRGPAAALALGLSLAAQPVFAQDAQATYDDIRKTLGGVPSFIEMYPKSAVAGAWQQYRDFLMVDTALDLKTKALISLAVAAQIPCQYCIWSDTRDALAAGATEEQVHEAVAIAGLTRNWSTIFNGYMIPFEQYKAELGGE